MMKQPNLRCQPSAQLNCEQRPANSSEDDCNQRQAKYRRTGRVPTTQLATKAFEDPCLSVEVCPQTQIKSRGAVKASEEPNHTQRAELLLIQATQVQLLQDPHFERLKEQFCLFLDENGIWRCGGHLFKAELPYGVKHPILLPRQHHLTTLVVRRTHSRVLHNGAKETLTEVSSKF